jgi:polyadenylate-binding protein
MTHPLVATAVAPGAHPAQGYKLNLQMRNVAGAGNSQLPSRQPPSTLPQMPEMPNLNAATLANVSPMEQKQLLGEVIYMKIAP